MLSLRPRLVVLAAAAVTAGLCAVAPPARAAAPAPAQPYRAVHTGLAHPLARATARPAAHALSSAARGSRPHAVAASTRAAARVVPATTGASGTILHNFNGVSSLDSQVTNYNQKFEPPDQGLCAGNGYVLEPVNSAYRIYDSSGHSLRGPFNVNDLFNVGGEEFTSDPRCYYEASTHTWYATILFLNAAFTSGDMLIAVNTTGDPTGLWKEYSINTDDLGGDGCPCFGDQPRMGIDHDNIYVSTDEFSINGPEYNGAQLYAISKSDLRSGASAVHYAHFADLSLGGSLSLAVQPALSSGTPNAEYFLSTLDPNATFDTRIGVWAITHAGRVTTGGTPTLSAKIISSEAYGPPPPAQQKGSDSTLDGGDDRMQQVQWIGGRIWGAFGTGVTIPGDSGPRGGAAWLAVKPRLSGGRIVSATITRQGYVASKGNSLLYPALQADASGRAAMVFTVSGGAHYPSAGYAVLPSSGTDFGPVTIAAEGRASYDKDATRWGDYSFATLDPASDSVWLSTEYVPPKASWTTTGQRNWGTRVFEVALQ